MTKNKYNYFFAVTFVVMAVLNILIGYINISSQEYVSYGFVSMKKSMLSNASEILTAYHYDEYPKAIAELQNEHSRYDEYLDALKKLNDPTLPENSNIKQSAKEKIGENVFSEEQVESRLELLSFCIQRLSYAADYPEYISSVNDNIAYLSDVELFGNDVKKQVVKAKNDFYGLDNINISAEPDISVNLLFSDTVTDILVISAAILSAFFYSLKCRTANGGSVGKSRVFIFVGLLAALTTAVYVSNICIIDSEIGLGDLGRSVQSVSEYRSCPYAISVGTLIIMRTAFKVSACVIIYLLCTKILLIRRKINMIPYIVLPIAAELLLHYFGSKFCFTTLFKTESIIGIYSNSSVFGEYVSTAAIALVMCAVLLLAAVIAAKKAVDNTLLAAKELSEKRYYDEINSKYTEAQMLRHDMKNHLTAIAILLDDGKISDARMYLKEINSEMDSTKLPIKTGLPVLDALLFKKLSGMRKNGVAVNIELTAYLSETGVLEYDLCGIFGNILDNAYEACVKLDDEDKAVNMTVKRQMDMLCIFCENRYKDINEDLSTQKQDKKYHGMGLRSIRRIAEKYDGTLDINFENGVFRLSVLLNITK